MANDRRQKREGKGLLFFGVLAGAIVGAALAFIYSPGTGEENREQAMKYISEKAGG